MNFEIRILKILIKFINDDMDGYNVSDTNQEDEIHKFIQDTFSPMDKDNQDYSHDVYPLLEKSCQLLYEGSTTNIYLLYCCW
jgi:hypothetical protein